jgi:UDP-N-acetylglucosamine:LPS N-acetylglucosamine transferase
MTPAFAKQDLAFATTLESCRAQVGDARFYVIPNASRWNKFGLVVMATRVLLLLMRERPDVVISTGAAPGYFAVRLGKLLGARTIWVDSIANAEKLSLSGKNIGKHADLWLTQWPHLAKPDGPHFCGSVL